jgi:hypothetical protein
LISGAAEAALKAPSTMLAAKSVEIQISLDFTV